MRASRWLIATCLCGLSLLLAAGGCNKNEKENSQDPPPKDATTQEAANSEPIALPYNEPKDAASDLRHAAVFMGTRALGQRFCIIADASNSMRNGPLIQLKK